MFHNLFYEFKFMHPKIFYWGPVVDLEVVFVVHYIYYVKYIHVLKLYCIRCFLLVERREGVDLSIWTYS